MPEDEPKNLPTPFTGGDLIAGVVHGITPVALKSLSRLVGAGLDYPAAWIERLTEGVRSKTASLKTVEGAVAQGVAKAVAEDEGIMARASEALLRKDYRRQANREAVAVGAAKLLIGSQEAVQSKDAKGQDRLVDEDWFNVFERHVEDASSENMRSIWSRVLAGEIHNPGSYSLRSLRCLSEMSQADALQFAECARFAIRNFIPRSLILGNGADIGPYLDLEAGGIIGGIAAELQQTLIPEDGQLHLIDGDYLLVFDVDLDAKISFGTVMLSSIGLELLSIMPDRDVPWSMRKFAYAIKQPSLKSATINSITGRDGDIVYYKLIESLWLDTQTVE